MNARKFAGLTGLLSADRPVIIQPHDYPDHDAVCSAFGLMKLLAHKGFRAIIRYRGAIPSASLQAIIDKFSIPVEPHSSEDPVDADVIVVDSGPGNGNITLVPGRLVGNIDHHLSASPPDCPFVDVRTDVGACSSIVADYWFEEGVEPDTKTATALIAGIQTDTDFLTRRVSETDLDAFYRLFPLAGVEWTARVIKASLSVEDLSTISEAISGGVIYAGCYFALLSQSCSQEVLAILADFLMRLREIRLVVIIETGESLYRVSARSKDPELSAASALVQALEGIGTGGGHVDMAGGVIRKDAFPGADAMWKRFVRAAWVGSGLSGDGATLG